MSLEFPVHIPFVQHLGFELLAFDAGQARLGLTLREELLNSWNVAHGGLTMTLLDVAMAHAARSPNQAGWSSASGSTPGVVTIEMKTSFMKPGLGRIEAQGRVLQRTVSLAFCEGEVRDAAGTLLAHATGTFKYLKGLPAGGRRIQRLNASD